MNVFIERFIGTFQRECLDYHYKPLNVKELSEITGAWLDKYHFYRPHEAPGFLTPRHQDDAPSLMTAQFSATVGYTIPSLAGVSYS
jgi:hypothetical protein